MPAGFSPAGLVRSLGPEPEVSSAASPGISRPIRQGGPHLGATGGMFWCPSRISGCRCCCIRFISRGWRAHWICFSAGAPYASHSGGRRKRSEAQGLLYSPGVVFISGENVVAPQRWCARWGGDQLRCGGCTRDDARTRLARDHVLSWCC